MRTVDTRFMGSRGWRALAASGLVVLTGAWFAVQVLLGRRADLTMYHRALLRQAELVKLHPTFKFYTMPAPHARDWWQPAGESLIALVACFVVVVALVVGGRRMWAILVAAMPLSMFAGIDDANSIGLGWMQPFNHLHAWLATGATVDAALVLTAVAVFCYLVPRRHATVAALPAVLRTLPIAIVGWGYWLVGHALPDPSDRVFVTRTLLIVLMAAIAATLRLPVVVRVALLLVMPFADPNMSAGLIGGYKTWWGYLHHVDVAVATALYVGGVPWLGRRLRRVRPSLDAATVTAG